MKHSLFLFLPALLILMLTACGGEAPPTEVAIPPTTTSTPTTPTPTQTSAYTIRVELISTTVWAEVRITNPQDVLSADLVSVSGRPIHREVSPEGQEVDQSVDAVRDGSEVGIIVDYQVKAEASERGVAFRLERHAINGLIVRIYHVIGEETQLIYELDHNNEIYTDANKTLNFTLDLNTLSIASAESPPVIPVHTLVPEVPVFLLAQLISDCTVGNGVTVGDTVIVSPGCDRWDYNKIERPFEDTFINYSPQSDISRAQIGYDEAWFFAQAITYFGEVVDPQPMNGTYGIELDTNLDGRGDILILADQPGSEWDVAGVQVWQDIDNTVGADTPVVADEDNPDGGYDEMIFDAGVGDDPDLAWARIAPNDPNIAQIAFKRSLGGTKQQFSWIMWAGLIDFVPPAFDLVDTYNREDIYAFDNTCSWTYGVQLQGLPNQCNIKVKEKIEDEDIVAGCVQPPPPSWTCESPPGSEHVWIPSECQWVCTFPDLP
jgi:hypothetical protein